MKKWFILTGALAALFIGGYFALTFYAVKLIRPQLQKVAGPGFTLAEIKLKPTYLSARGIHYEDPDSKQRFLQIEEVRIHPSLLSLLTKSLHIKELTFLRSSFFFYRSREGVFVGPWVIKKEREKGEAPEEEEKKKGDALQVRIDRIRIRKGSVDVEDRKVGEPPTHIKLRELDFEIKDIRYPLASMHSAFELKGKMEGRKKEGTFDAKGWIDVKTMDMETSLKIREIEVKTFEPYYRKRVTAEIESGYLDMDSKMAVREKRIDAPGELDLIDLHVKEGSGMVLWVPAETLVSLLEKKGHQIKVRFHVKGNLENPQFSLQETFLAQVAISFAQALGIPIKVVGEEILQGTLKGEKGLAEGLQSIEDLFKKKREKKR